MKQPRRAQRGVIMLIVVIFIGSILAVYGLSTALLSLDTALTSYASLEHASAGALADSCVDYALARLSRNSGISGNVNLSLSNIDCVVAVSGSGNIRTLVANATSTDAFEGNTAARVTVKVNINTNPFTIEDYKDILE